MPNSTKLEEIREDVRADLTDEYNHRNNKARPAIPKKRFVARVTLRASSRVELTGEYLAVHKQARDVAQAAVAEVKEALGPAWGVTYSVEINDA